MAKKKVTGRRDSKHTVDKNNQLRDNERMKNLKRQSKKK